MFRVYVLFTIVIICNNSNSYENFRNRIWSIPVKHVVRFLVRSHEIPRDGGGISRKPQSWLPQAKKHIDIPRSSHCWPTKISHVYPIFIPLSVTMPFISQLFSHENIPLLSHYCPWIFDWPIVTTINIKYPLSELTIVTDILTIITTILRPILDTLQKVKFLVGS